MISQRFRRIYCQLNQKAKINKSFLLYTEKPCYQINNCRSIITKTNLFTSNTGEKNWSNPAIKATSVPQDSKLVLNDDDYLTKLLAHIANHINDRNRVYKNDLKNAIEKITDKSHVHTREGVLLLRCCSNLLPDEKPANRMKLLDTIWNVLLKTSTIHIDHYNALLQCYIDNGHKFSAHEFIENMAPSKPTEVTYKLLLYAICQMGNMNQALEIMQNMKSAKIPITEYHLNSMIEGYGIAGDMKSAFDVFENLKSIQTEPSVETKKSLIKAYASCGDLKNVKLQLSQFNGDEIPFTNEQVLDIINCLMKNNMSSLLTECLLLLPESSLSSTNSLTYLHSFCTQLIHQGHYIDAYKIYNFLPVDDVGILNNVSPYSRIFIRECIKSDVPYDKLIFIIDGLIESKRNPLAGYMAYEASIHFNKYDLGVNLLKHLKKIDQPIRCHFFWPLFIAASKTSGETGIFNILTVMDSLGLTVDYDTLVDYVLPHVNMSIPGNLLKKFQNHGFNTSACLTPIMHHLLKSHKTQSAAELCELSDGKLDCENIIFPLLLSYLSTGDVDSVHNILKAFQERPKFEKDWIGNFLVKFSSYRKWKVDIKYFNNLLRVLLESGTKISPQAIELCCQNLEKFPEHLNTIEETKHNLSLMKNIDLVDQSLENSSQNNQMTIKELETHLIELESKDMNTRGVLRKLLQLYCRHNDIKNAKKILEKCNIEEVVLSAGMKASIMDLYIKCEDLKMAEIYYNDLKSMHSTFTLDEYKILSYATLLVKEGKLKNAIEILEKKAKHERIRGGKNLETNCWKLLNAIAANGNPDETENVLELLIKLGYCRVSNVLLGPQIRVHLLNGEVSYAVEQFLRCVKKYRKTPLKHELLCILVAGCNKDQETDNIAKNDIRNEYKRMLMEVQEGERAVHGSGSAILSIVAALADTGLSKPLRRFLLQPSFNLSFNSVYGQCLRFADEKKLDALLILVQNLEGIRDMKLNAIYELIMKVYDVNNDYNGALNIWNQMESKKILPTPNTVLVLSSMLKSHNQNIPVSLMVHMKEKASISDVDVRRRSN